MSEHATLSASASSRWLACPGSIALSEGKPDSSSDSARWGTAAHQVAAWCLEDGHMAKAYEGRIIEVEGHSYEVDDEMVYQVQTYLDIVRELVAETGGKLLVEQRVDYTHLFTTDEKQFGTGDALILADDKLYVIDLKTGQKAVEAEDNTQLGLYALGAIEEHDPAGMVYGWSEVELIIVQPPKSSRPIRWTASMEWLDGLSANATTAGNTALSLRGKPAGEIEVYTVAGEHCTFCRAKADCPKLRREVASTVFADLNALEADAKAPAPVSPTESEDLAQVYSKLDMIEEWVSAMRARAFGHAMAGGELPGYKLVAGKKGARKWSDEQKAEEILKSMRLKHDEMYSFKLITPTQAEKLLKESPRRWSKVSMLIEQAQGGPVLAPESDKRDAIRVAPAVDDFQDLDAVAVDDLI